MRSTQFFDPQDLPISETLNQETQAGIYARAVHVNYNGDYSGEIKMSSSVNGKYVEVDTDFATLNRIALDPNSGPMQNFQNKANETISVSLVDIEEFVAEAYRAEAINQIENMPGYLLLEIEWIRAAGDGNLPV